MAVYVIGDIQGCYKNLQRLLTSLDFDPENDCLWFAGDLVNRGEDSLKVLRFVKSLGDRAVTVLGNHDLHLLSAYYSGTQLKPDDTLNKVINAPDSKELMHWLRFRPLLHHDIDLNFSLVHAGIYPGWCMSDALSRAREVEAVLQQDGYKKFLLNMYGNKPDCWSEDLQGIERLRFITNVFTRMRYLKTDLTLDLAAKGAPSKLKNITVIPWFEFKQSSIKFNRVAFGHWSTLPTGQYGNCFALDSGCVWGAELTALRIDKKTPRWFRLSCDID
ncbi:MAG: symmetrical bis(5'-nucleosyl)-tetraphosphatase [Gammaproteobacteria bacterium]|jgi:bis(5'-nucleosyl)-tetraphosphatase (symmetrical)|nr:symmetrical bis(5'-nucleosyl)-tetraphosphatase [Gammaproteobacteria bacterium]MBT3724984.1 symmetrical bis(5'-nucleosyl)-tetraphosphatase [Gammaproteobacteria bacterium]MBT4075389.1 symmetrical bis(5'-nucleosyl)-tetraphosphatase [Gammaproteobacteria bacterium]MBT4194714.1 symmetrical bis(5'-nucleosyl)-tetraphosphatase [Gammaproteobacteria bacterium]MBT4449696.1 symmetrical bis(5'-nucleosyl)-tetraphosphatase [Gammaproteobacteria bacterium]